jgi:hypothetical protein
MVVDAIRAVKTYNDLGDARCSQGHQRPSGQRSAMDSELIHGYALAWAVLLDMLTVSSMLSPAWTSLPKARMHTWASRSITDPRPLSESVGYAPQPPNHLSDTLHPFGTCSAVLCLVRVSQHAAVSSATSTECRDAVRVSACQCIPAHQLFTTLVQYVSGIRPCQCLCPAIPTRACSKAASTRDTDRRASTVAVALW